MHAAVVKSVIDESTKDKNDTYSSRTILSFLARNQKQVEALCEIIDSGFSVSEVMIDMIDILEVDVMIDAVATVRKCAGAKVCLATPRIIKPGEEGIWKALLRLEPDGLLIRSSGLVHKLQTLGGCGANVDVGGEMMVKIHKLMGDFSLNAINTVTSSELLDYGGMSRLTAGYDQSASAITELAKAMLWINNMRSIQSSSSCTHYREFNEIIFPE
jgi:putative protease